MKPEQVDTLKQVLETLMVKFRLGTVHITTTSETVYLIGCADFGARASVLGVYEMETGLVDWWEL